MGTVIGETVERFRKCLKCGENYNTVEAIIYDPQIQEYAQRAFKTNDNIRQYIPK